MNLERRLSKLESDGGGDAPLTSGDLILAAQAGPVAEAAALRRLSDPRNGRLRTILSRFLARKGAHDGQESGD